ncbi:iron-sulfur cluster assembly scaffold protein [Kiloniella laminariae]|uniref:Iron-sulfur cluster assembly scaffold protein n=1 Tax=Kiloniella laminariae TaxID=454162 RepID=A0ABT4LK07_9PROT|nr:iron-sulfur cluster assembly scaffold protein [Kiloniella laminariae]MCZ4281421.1 iron-sulfur cluster assembly scaffold protein [Kiloniella laminariae]
MQDDALYNKSILKLASAGDSPLAHPDISVLHDNPLCGDRITLDLTLDQRTISALGYKARSCALCKASAELLRTCAVGKDLETITNLHLQLKMQLKEQAVLTFSAPWKKFSLFQPAVPIKNRHSCILLPFQAIEKIERKN